ncbi:MAG: hypothetical protein RL653_2849 [Pseudomonadota bacterium]
MTPDARKAWAGNAAAGGLLALLYGGDVVEHVRIQAAEVYAVAAPPVLPFAVGVLGLLACGAGAAVFGLARRLGPSWRGYRLLPILAVLALFLDLFVLHGDADRMPSDEKLHAQLQALAEAATHGSGEQRVLEDARELQALLGELGRPAYLVRGEPVQGFRLEIQTGCSGPRPPPAGSAVGTLLYCVEVGGQQAWISAQALPVESVSGAAAAFTRQGGLITARVTPAPPRPAREPESGEPLGPEGAAQGN